MPSPAPHPTPAPAATGTSKKHRRLTQLLAPALAPALALALALGGTAAVTPLTQLAPASAQDDPLAQVIDPNQARGSGQVVVDDGHIDYGPTLGTGEFAMEIHDDTTLPQVWRAPQDVVAWVHDSSQLTVPDSPDYKFLGLPAGSKAWVVPQVRKPGVIWVGWNTQEPQLRDALALGATQRILGVDGPGKVGVFLQSGNFGAPEPLWTTDGKFPQDNWIEVNTHTHANWVFEKPGVYLVQIEFRAKLNSGEEVSAQNTLRFAIGDETDPQTAFGVEYTGARGAAGADAAGADATGAHAADAKAADAKAAENGAGNAAADGGQLGPVIGGIAAAVIVALLIAALVLSRETKKAKERARQAAAQAAASTTQENGEAGETDA